MGISLNKEQFYQRLQKHHRLLMVAIEEDVKSISPLNYKIPSNETEIRIDLSKPIGELIRKEIFRVIDLVYEETLD
jgi:hypothetical protein